MILKPTKT